MIRTPPTREEKIVELVPVKYFAAAARVIIPPLFLFLFASSLGKFWGEKFQAGAKQSREPMVVSQPFIETRF